MQYRLPLFLVALIIQTSFAPPVTQEKKDGDHKDKEDEVDDMEDIGNEYQIEYQRYLKEVVQALESDVEFRAKLEKANEDDIRTGKIAHELQFVDHKIRTKLDELKREELERLRHLATKEHNLINGLDLEHIKVAEHLDHSNSHTFEIDDLKKLIAKTTKDLADADKRRRQQFKEYEMTKKFEEEQHIKGNTDMTEEKDRQKYQEHLEAMKKQHKDHKPLHHPGSKQQLEEVWEKQDHMETQDFNPKTFFYLHDLDGNGFWDQDEVKILFLKELDKLYSENAPEDDINERREEMERMREHVFKEADLNHDGLISYQEFLEQTKKPDFQQDEGWQGLDEQQIFSQEEYEAFQKHRQKEIQDLIAKGMLPPPPDTAQLPLQHEQFPPQYQQQQYHPQQIHPPQQYPGQVPPQQPVVGQVPPGYQGQVPQQQIYQPPPQQHYPDKISQQHQYQAQQPQYQVPVPQQNFHAQPQYQPQQAQQQFQGQPQQTQQQFQGQPQQPQQVQQQSQGQPQQAQQQTQQQTQQTQNQVPHNTQGNAPTNNQGVAQPSHNLPQNPKSAEQQINQNNIPKVQKV